MKVYYDVCMVVLSVLVGILFLSRPVGVGIATVVSAVFVGRILSWLQKHMILKPV